jgi:hypothetical protein
MAIGYDEARPPARDYELFIKRAANGLKGMEGVSFVTYGSFDRGTYTAGRSDIDSVIIFPKGVAVPKQLMHDVACIFDISLDGLNIPFKPAPLDIASCSDGRFNSFTAEYKDHLMEGTLVCGPDYWETITFLNIKHGEESSLAHNLRKARSGRLLAEHYNQADAKEAIKQFNGTLNATLSAPRQLLSLLDIPSEGTKGSQIELFSEYFPSIKTEPLRTIRHYFKNTEVLDRLYKDYSGMMEVWDNSLTCLEEMVGAFIRNVPRD